MGANFITRRWDGALSKDEVRSRFDAEHEQSRYEDGNSYSGEIGMATGLVFGNRTFTSLDDAYEYLEDAAEKWGPAVVVKATEGGKEYWVLGATCSS